MIKRTAAMTLNFLMEFILMLLVTFFFYISQKELPPILNLFGFAFGSFVPFILLLQRFTNKGKLLYIIVIFPLLLFGGIMAGFQLISIIIIGVLVFWRGLSLYNDHEAEYNIKILFISFMLGVLLIIYSGASHYPYQNVMIGLLILQIVLVLMGLFFSKWQAISENRGKFSLYFGGFLGGVAVLGVLVTFGLNLIQYLFFGMATFIVRGFAYIMIPIQYLFQLFMNLFGLKRRDFKVTETGPVEFKDKVNGVAYTTSESWVTILLIALAIYLVYYIYKKRNILLSKNHVGSSVAILEEVTEEEGGFFFNKRPKPPKDPIRSEIFHLERLAHKLKLGRRPFESITEWWARIGIAEQEDLSKIYEKVRYGESPSTPEDHSKVKEGINNIKKWLKENDEKESS